MTSRINSARVADCDDVVFKALTASANRSRRGGAHSHALNHNANGSAGGGVGRGHVSGAPGSSAEPTAIGSPGVAITGGGVGPHAAARGGALPAGAASLKNVSHPPSTASGGNAIGNGTGRAGGSAVVQSHARQQQQQPQLVAAASAGAGAVSSPPPAAAAEPEAGGGSSNEATEPELSDMLLYIRSVFGRVDVDTALALAEFWRLAAMIVGATSGARNPAAAVDAAAVAKQRRLALGGGATGSGDEDGGIEIDPLQIQWLEPHFSAVFDVPIMTALTNPDLRRRDRLAGILDAIPALMLVLHKGLPLSAAIANTPADWAAATAADSAGAASAAVTSGASSGSPMSASIGSSSSSTAAPTPTAGSGVKPLALHTAPASVASAAALQDAGAATVPASEVLASVGGDAGSQGSRRDDNRTAQPQRSGEDDVTGIHPPPSADVNSAALSAADALDADSSLSALWGSLAAAGSNGASASAIVSAGPQSGNNPWGTMLTVRTSAPDAAAIGGAAAATPSSVSGGSPPASMNSSVSVAKASRAVSVGVGTGAELDTPTSKEAAPWSPARVLATYLRPRHTHPRSYCEQHPVLLRLRRAAAHLATAAAAELAASTPASGMPTPTHRGGAGAAGIARGHTHGQLHSHHHHHHHHHHSHDAAHNSSVNTSPSNGSASTGGHFARRSGPGSVTPRAGMPQQLVHPSGFGLVAQPPLPPGAPPRTHQPSVLPQAPHGGPGPAHYASGAAVAAAHAAAHSRAGMSTAAGPPVSGPWARPPARPPIVASNAQHPHSDGLSPPFPVIPSSTSPAPMSYAAKVAGASRGPGATVDGTSEATRPAALGAAAPASGLQSGSAPHSAAANSSGAVQPTPLDAMPGTESDDAYLYTALADAQRSAPLRQHMLRVRADFDAFLRQVWGDGVPPPPPPPPLPAPPLPPAPSSGSYAVAARAGVPVSVSGAVAGAGVMVPVPVPSRGGARFHAGGGTGASHAHGTRAGAPPAAIVFPYNTLPGVASSAPFVDHYLDSDTVLALAGFIRAAVAASTRITDAATLRFDRNACACLIGGRGRVERWSRLAVTLDFVSLFEAEAAANARSNANTGAAGSGAAVPTPGPSSTPGGARPVGDSGDASDGSADNAPTGANAGRCKPGGRRGGSHSGVTGDDAGGTGARSKKRGPIPRLVRAVLSAGNAMPQNEPPSNLPAGSGSSTNGASSAPPMPASARTLSSPAAAHAYCMAHPILARLRREAAEETARLQALLRRRVLPDIAVPSEASGSHDSVASGVGGGRAPASTSAGGGSGHEAAAGAQHASQGSMHSPRHSSLQALAASFGGMWLFDPDGSAVAADGPDGDANAGVHNDAANDAGWGSLLGLGIEMPASGSIALSGRSSARAHGTASLLDAGSLTSPPGNDNNNNNSNNNINNIDSNANADADFVDDLPAYVSPLNPASKEWRPTPPAPGSAQPLAHVGNRAVDTNSGAEAQINQPRLVTSAGGHSTADEGHPAGAARNTWVPRSSPASLGQPAPMPAKAQQPVTTGPMVAGAANFMTLPVAASHNAGGAPLTSPYPTPEVLHMLALQQAMLYASLGAPPEAAAAAVVNAIQQHALSQQAGTMSPPTVPGVYAHALVAPPSGTLMVPAPHAARGVQHPQPAPAAVNTVFVPLQVVPASAPLPTGSAASGMPFAPRPPAWSRY